MSDCLLVADDLTGAADAGNEFAARGYSTSIALVDEFDNQDDTVAVVDTDSRYDLPDVASDTVTRAVRNSDADVVYKKVDSTLRGNVAAETDAVISASGADVGVVAPAFPAVGRQTACGYHLVNGTLVTDSDAGDDPTAAPPTASVPELFADLDRHVAEIGIDQVSRGPAAVRDATSIHKGIVDGAPILVYDATHTNHLEAIAAGASESTPVYVGSAGLAGHVSLDAPVTGAVDVPTDRDGPVLAIAGSAHPQTQRQVRAVLDEAIVPLNAANAVHDPDAVVSGARDRCVETLRTHGRAVLTTARSENDIEAARAAATELGLEDSELRDRIGRAVESVTTRALEESSVDALFLTGGETAKRTLSALGVRGLRLTGSVVGDGIPIATAAGGEIDGAPVVTKAGAFGDGETILNCLARLREIDG